MNPQGAMPAYPEWRPIESAPKDGTDVLIWNGEVTIAYFEGSKEWPQSPERFNQWTTGMTYSAGYDCGFDRITQPTHWMPLPEPPALSDQPTRQEDTR